MNRPANFKTTFLVIFLSFSIGQVFAQLNSCDSLRLFLKSHNLSEGRKVIFRTLNHQPSQGSCFYQTALEIYDSSLVKSPSNTLLKDSIFKILNLWSVINNSCEVLNEEAKRYYLYKKDDKHYKDDICPYLRTSFLNCQTAQFSPESILSLNECFLISTYNREETQYSCKLEEKIWLYLNNHQQLTGNPEWKIFKNRVRNALLTCPFITCAKLDSLFVNEIESQDLKAIKQLNSILSQKNCIANKLYAATAEKILIAEPSFNGLYNFGITSNKNGSLTKAYSSFIKAEKLAPSKQQKSLCFLRIAELLEVQKNYEKAKEFAQIAIENDPDNQESFVFLAHLFAKADSICTLKSLEKAALYILIANNYKKGGLIAESNNYYQKSDIDNLIKKGTITKGQKTLIECFIKEEILLTK
ncbi:MAG: hypothetical protein H7329_18110 [Opitutaceae bacterium]|nr:hypothetical protein [Cytophagales bacterium]